MEAPLAAGNVAAVAVGEAEGKDGPCCCGEGRPGLLSSHECHEGEWVGGVAIVAAAAARSGAKEEEEEARAAAAAAAARRVLAAAGARLLLPPRPPEMLVRVLLLQLMRAFAELARRAAGSGGRVWVASMNVVFSNKRPSRNKTAKKRSSLIKNSLEGYLMQSGFH